MRNPCRTGTLLALCFAAALPASSAGAAVAPASKAPAADLAGLRAGTALVQFDARRGGRKAFRASLARAGLRAVVMRKLPFAAVRGTRADLRRAARLRGVVAARMNERLALELHESAPLVFGGESARASTYAGGFDGRGVNVAVVDSGADGTHPDLVRRMVANVKVLDAKGLLDEAEAAPSAPQYAVCPVACTTDTTSGHGTHVAGIIVGDGTASDGYHRGVAPGAGLVSLSVGEAVALFYVLQAYDYLLTHPELGVVAVNNSFGPGGGGLVDARSPLAVATKRLHDAGIAVVFSAGNSGTGAGPDPEGSSNCSPTSDGTCKSNPNGVVPWAISVANGRKDAPGGAGAQGLALSSSRGDPVPRQSVDGSLTIPYGPTLTAPGTNIWSARSSTSTVTAACGTSSELPSCIPAKPEYLARYVPISGTSMAAPHVAGAVAVLQSAAKVRSKRLLTPPEVKGLLTRTATPMTARDGLYDFPCGTLPFLVCGDKVAGTTGAPYAAWQVGAGALNIPAAIAALPAPPAPTPSPRPRPRPKPKPTARG